ncbi:MULTISPECIES: hypothetical protein [Dickeya]|uniref:Uncharacterized protein n=1 Tax=Dickeya aquatica TaxID=1401087 RepID=A0A375A9T7_9GAMM|nr:MULTISPECIES: hypothetical protein [Dickeya]SLM62775.1 hypothetical protein DAQ1742_01838 [Dickeya aquatica]
MNEQSAEETLSFLIEEMKSQYPWFYVSCLLEHDLLGMANEFIKQKVADESLHVSVNDH